MMRNKKQKINRHLSGHKRGFTLVELLVSMFIFTIIILAVVAIFARQTQSFKFLQAQQRNIENAQFALNFVAKILRTSTVVGFTDEATQPTSKSVYAFDGSGGKCFHFEFDDAIGALMVEELIPPADVAGDPRACARKSTFIGGDPPYQLTTGYVVGQFDVVPTDDGRRPGDEPREDIIMGRATIQMDINLSATSTESPTGIQTSVSFRDYPAELRF